uniref:Amotoxin n=1 Tax=Amolops loloensis TaxID=318551 RepID=A0A7M3UN68_AMOLO|nr:amotoxin [Amolops loloensis]
MKTSLLLAVIATSLLMFQLTSADRNPICNLPPKEGFCLWMMRRSFFNPSKGRCDTFGYRGCGGNKNNFETPRACKEACG